MQNNANFRIIIIDDNPEIHYDFLKILQNDTSSALDELSAKIFDKPHIPIILPQFEIDTALQGQEGVARIKEAIKVGKNYSLAFVDIRMPPGWDGIETIKRIWEIDKDIQVVICTAYSDYSWEETITHLGQSDNLLILKKPFDNVAVRQLACALTKKWQLLQEARKYTESLNQQIEARTLSLQESLSLVKSTFESSNDGILVLSNERKIIDYNQKFIDMFTVPANVVADKNEDSLFHYLRNQLSNPAEFFTKLHALRDKLQETSVDIIKLKNHKIFECYTQPHKLEDKIIGRILDFRDITKRALLEQELQHQATHDPLTGLANRVLLTEKIREAIKASSKNNTEFAVVFMDLDRFKLVNDSLSHTAGDELLNAVANRLRSQIRHEDTLARIGGDEFVIVYTNFAKTSDIIKKINQLLASFQQPFSITHREIMSTASIGVSIYPKNGTSVDVLLRNADAAMYRAKAQKGNCFNFYTDDINTVNFSLLDLEIQLRNAITNKEFFLVYQPQMDLTKEKLTAVEALIRWQHPEKGVLLPIDFIPAAEELGLTTAIGEWVMHTACKQNKAWQDAGFPPIRVAVNVTNQQFSDKNLPNIVKKILQDTGLPAEYLELELTENVILSNYQTMHIITQLKELGVRIAVDDFGTGYSSLSYLQKIPLDRLKIDSSFIQHIQASSNDEVIIRAVIAMAKNLNLEVVAEGVETQEQVNFLKRHQCEDVQGFFYSKPLTVPEIEAYFRNPPHAEKARAKTTKRNKQSTK